WLIKKQEAWRSCEREANLKPALFAISQVRNRPVRPLDEADQSERMVDLFAKTWHPFQQLEQIEPERAAQFRERRDGQVLAHSQAVEQLIDLVALGETELADIGHRHAGNIATLEQDLARGGRHFAGQHLEEGAFAGTIRPDD